MSKKMIGKAPDSHLGERGVISITVTMILMVVLSLLVIGFAQISRRNERQALDQQLSTQAFYAAESGVNAARNAIDAAGSSAVIPAKTSCGAATGIYNGLDGVISAAQNISYSCLLVDPAPSTLRYGSVGDQATIVPINAATGTLNKITLTWKSKAANTTPVTGCPTALDKAFKPSAAWVPCGYGVLRFDLVPTDASFDIDELSAGQMTTFAVPILNGAGAITYAPGAANDITAAKCTNAECSLTITIPAPQASFMMRVRSLYNTSSLEISANADLVGAQAVLDVTGKAQDVLRRIQVRVPLAGSSKNKLPDYAMQSRDSICKRFSVMSNYFSIDSAVDPLYSPQNGGNPLCKSH